MKEIKSRKGIDAQGIKSALLTRKESLDEKAIAIIQFLAAFGPHSASDADLQKAVDLTRKPLSDRLKNLTTKLGLHVTNQPSGKTIKTLYSLPEINFGD